MKHKMIALITLILSLQSFAGTEGDNTKFNKRDRASGEMTADKQSHKSSDMNITRKIRQEIMKEDNFSTYAQNVKIITVDGKVTLKGPVQSEQERSGILKYANVVAGSSNVKNEMSIVKDKK